MVMNIMTSWFLFSVISASNKVPQEPKRTK